MGYLNDLIAVIGGLGNYFGDPYILGAFVLMFFIIMCTFLQAGADLFILVMIVLVSLLCNNGFLPEILWWAVMAGIAYLAYQAILRVSDQG